MKYRMGFLVPLLLLMVLVFIGAAEAAFAFDLVVSGPSMRHPVTLRWDQMASAIEKEAVGKGADPTHSFIPFVHPVAEPQNALGPAYDLKALTFVPSIPPHPLGIEHWTYYPRADVVRQVDSHARVSWGQPVPAFRALLDGAIAAGKGQAILWPVAAATLIVLSAALFLVAWRRRQALGLHSSTGVR